MLNLAWLTNEPTLSIEAKNAIANPDLIVFVSAASTWEIAIKKSLGKLESPDDLVEQIAKQRFKSLPMSIEQTLLIEKLPDHHQDTFDHILIVQA